MVGKAKALSSVVKLGVKYGPAAYEAVKHGREPAMELAQKKLSKLTARKKALKHAEGLMDGSALSVWQGDQQLWIVFNGDDPIASHPAADTPLPQLIQGYDLSKRVRPTIDQRPKTGPLSAIRRRR